MLLLQPTIIPRDIDRRYADALTVDACARPMHAMLICLQFIACQRPPRSYRNIARDPPCIYAT